MTCAFEFIPKGIEFMRIIMLALEPFFGTERYTLKNYNWPF
jgi:hypothetical protein